MVKENCGVVGIFSLDGTNVIPMVIDSLRALQHRGQEAWGLAIPNKPPLKKIGQFFNVRNCTIMCYTKIFDFERLCIFKIAFSYSRISDMSNGSI